MRIVVTGGRDYENVGLIWAVLDTIHESTPIDLLAHGACHLGGADIHAENWAKSREVPYMGIPAKFKTGKKGKAEGMIRNGRMLDLVKPDLVVAFPGGNGTAGCIKEAIKREIKVETYD